MKVNSIGGGIIGTRMSRALRDEGGEEDGSVKDPLIFKRDVFKRSSYQPLTHQPIKPFLIPFKGLFADTLAKDTLGKAISVFNDNVLAKPDFASVLDIYYDAFRSLNKKMVLALSKKDFRSLAMYNNALKEISENAVVSRQLGNARLFKSAKSLFDDIDKIVFGLNPQKAS